MNKKQVLEVIKIIEHSYNNPFTRKRNMFNEDKSDKEVILETVDFWHKMLENQNPKDVMKRLNKHVLTDRFPPTIADLYEEPTESKINHEHLSFMRNLRGEDFYRNNH